MDYYKILEVANTATSKEIKTAYKRLASEHHPDKPNGSKEKFQQIQEAYEVLSSPSKRAYYDKTGEKDEKHEQLTDEEKADMILFNTFTISVRNGEFKGIIAATAEFLNDSIATLRSTIYDQNELIASTKKELGRVSVASGVDQYELALLAHIQSLEVRIAALQQDVEIGRLAAGKLKEYQDPKELESTEQSNNQDEDDIPF